MKILAVITAFLCCCGVQISEQSSDLEQQILNSGTVVFLDFVKKVKYATEKLIRDDQFTKSRITFQGYMKALRLSAEEMSNPESAGGSHGNSDIPIQRFFTAAVVTFGQMTRDVFDRFFSPYFKIYRETLKKETIRDIWKEVDSYYFPGAPPINSKPMEFLSYLLGKAVVKSRIVGIVEAGVGAIGKIDINHFNEIMQSTLSLIRSKAFEISVLEKQKTNNSFLVSLRTVSRLIVLSCDCFFEVTESSTFMEKLSESVVEWNKLTQLKNPSEQRHIILNLDVWITIMDKIKVEFKDFGEEVARMYFILGTITLGSERYKRFNRAVLFSPVVFSLPVFEKLSEVAFGFTEINRFLNRVNYMIEKLIEDYDRDELDSLSMSMSKILMRFNEVFQEEKSHHHYSPKSLPLRLIRRAFLGYWMVYYKFENEIYMGTTETEIESVWINAKKIIINEMVKSKAFTRQQLQEAPKLDSLSMSMSKILMRFNEVFQEEKSHHHYSPKSLPLRLIRRAFLGYWMVYYKFENEIYMGTTETEIESVWINAKKIIINEMVKSKAFTRQQLQEAPNDFVEGLRKFLNEIKQTDPLADGFEELIDPITLSLKRWMYISNKIICDTWDLLLD